MEVTASLNSVYTNNLPGSSVDKSVEKNESTVFPMGNSDLNLPDIMMGLEDLQEFFFMMIGTRIEKSTSLQTGANLNKMAQV